MSLSSVVTLVHPSHSVELFGNTFPLSIAYMDSRSLCSNFGGKIKGFYVIVQVKS